MALELKITIDELLIRMKTNIPDKSLVNVDFNRNMLHIPSDMRKPEGVLNTYPYFTSDIKYPSQLENLDYIDRIEFFFNKQEFTKRLKPYVKEKTLDEELTKSNSEKNVLTTLKLLFPTTFPVVDNLHESYDLIIKRDSTLPLWAFLKNPLNRKFYYSHLNLNGTIFTFKKVTWLNDILNNPVYQQIFIEYNRIVPPINKYLDDLSQDNNTALENIKKSILLLTNDEGLFQKMLKAAGSSNYPKPIKDLITSLTEIGKTTVTTLTEEKTNEFQANIKAIENPLKDRWTIDGKTSAMEFPDLKASIDNEIESIQTNMKKIEDNYEEETNIKRCFKERFVEISKDPVFSLPSEFENDLKNFLITTLSQYRRPIRISSNHKLQTYLEQKTNLDTIKFFHFLEQAYQAFMNNTDFNEEQKELVNIGISTLTPGTVGQRKKEIHINCELIGGEVNKNNIRDIYCPFVSDTLGNKLKDYIEQNNINTTFWQLKTSEPIFNIETNESTNATSDTSEPKNDNNISSTNKNRDFLQKSSNKTESIVKKVDEGAKNNFQSKIMFNKGYSKEINEKIKNVNAYKPDLLLKSDNMYDFISSKDKSIINFITEWNKDQYKNVDLLVSMQSKIKEYEANIDGAKTKFKNKDFTTEQERLENNYKIASYNLLIEVLKVLIIDEDKKQKLNKGGKSKTMRKKFKSTKRNTLKK
tara:strand:- start:267 stop:2357 length:2091 start_codon:yes stop_codon:yes gene_type:complete